MIDDTSRYLFIHMHDHGHAKIVPNIRCISAQVKRTVSSLKCHKSSVISHKLHLNHDLYQFSRVHEISNKDPPIGSVSGPRFPRDKHSNLPVDAQSTATHQISSAYSQDLNVGSPCGCKALLQSLCTPGLLSSEPSLTPRGTGISQTR